ncbi:glycoside hydrolase family 47 protein [Parathielavia appendiculata]|uniref:alpha-1,2-Mannosidase n=1 Tax=Parathielavia appendiculata TaxID=2587402 RepID=A0AAN6U180_9PEZI|nr:glycoside hydrolase family 47 protein [Parathielavia appendiculata]
MLRLRRYRVLLICALAILVLLYHVSKNSQWDHSNEIWHHRSHAGAHSKPRPPAPPPASKPEHVHEHKPNRHTDTDEQPQRPHHKPPRPPPHPSSPVQHDNDYRLTSDQESPIWIPQLKTSDGVPGGYSLPTNAATVPDRRPPSNPDEYQRQNENDGVHIADSPGKYQEDAVAIPTTTIHWQKPREWYPVPEESLIMLPTGKPMPIPPVQFAFGEESPEAKEKREVRLAKVRDEARHAWAGYKKYAWTHDELTPVTKKAKDPFCGWAATLVDALDTLWIMGLKDEFDEAVEAVKEIDFTTTPYREDIPVFETIIRYLGGLVGAYDVTGNDARYRSLLDKAVELAEILMSVFDTPNRLPVLYYNWKPAHNINPKQASINAGVAELGSMSMEFTRLAQLTGKHIYYDAIARITDAFEELQNRENGTAISGVFPQNLDASGCNRTAARLVVAMENSSDAAQKQAGDVDLGQTSEGYESQHNMGASDDSGSGQNKGFHGGAQKRTPPPHGASAPLNAKGQPGKAECVPQPLVGASWGSGSYSMGGSQDSTYEYFPKQYLMLGGLEPKYRTMHEKTVDGVTQYLLFRPMAEGDPDILFAAKAYSTDGTTDKMSYEWEVTHLTCFLGGMYGLGGKIFNRPHDVEIAKKLADGCVWAYDVMPAGIMPEYATEAWYAALDPNAEWRERQMEEYYDRLAEWKERKEQLLRKQAEERKRQAEAQKQAAAEEEERIRRRSSQGQDVARQTPEGSPLPELRQQDTASAAGFQKRAAQGEFGTASDQTPMPGLTVPPAPVKPLTHQEHIAQRLEKEHIPPGFVTLSDKRPEAIESVWYMYRITGDPEWQEKGWRMFEAVVRATRTEAGHSAIRDVTARVSGGPNTLPDMMEDSMESFWLAETLKYFYLLFETPDVISLDEIHNPGPLLADPLSDRVSVQAPLGAVLDPLEPFFSPLKARVRCPGATTVRFDPTASEVEGFAHPLWGWWIDGYRAGTDPESTEYWVYPSDNDQRMVDIYPLRFTLAVAPQIWEGLSERERGNVEARLANSINEKKQHAEHELALVPRVCELGLKKNAGKFSQERLDADIKHLDTFYSGDGWSNDGPEGIHPMDYYSSSFSIQFLQLLYFKLAGEEDPERAAEFRKRAQMAALDLAHQSKISLSFTLPLNHHSSFAAAI